VPFFTPQIGLYSLWDNRLVVFQLCCDLKIGVAVYRI
jgi:hypothetical protein